MSDVIFTHERPSRTCQSLIRYDRVGKVIRTKLLLFLLLIGNSLSSKNKSINFPARGDPSKYVNV